MNVEHFPRDPSAPIYADITGKRFSSLVAQTYIGLPTSRRWLCICDCGESIIAAKYDLISGTKTTCGKGQHKPKQPPRSQCYYCHSNFSSTLISPGEKHLRCPRCKDASRGLNEQEFYKWVQRVHSRLTIRNRPRNAS